MAKTFLIILSVIAVSLTYNQINSISDADFCHPHCLITCLPSCQCCDSNNENEEKTGEESIANQLKLEQLVQILKDKDLEVGIVCHSSCKDRCLPSCRFECCRPKKKIVHKKTSKFMDQGFDLHRLLQSMEQTQKEYKKLQEYLKQVNASKLANQRKNFHFNTVTKLHKKKRGKKNESHEKSVKLLENLVKLQDALDDKQVKEEATANIKEIVKQSNHIQNIFESPYHKLLASKPKLRIEIQDGGDKESKMFKSINKGSTEELKKSDKTKMMSKKKSHTRGKAPSIFEFISSTDKDSKETKEKHCSEACKKVCSPDCDFNCCIPATTTSDALYDTKEKSKDTMNKSHADITKESATINKTMAPEPQLNSLNETMLTGNFQNTLQNNTKNILDSSQLKDNIKPLSQSNFDTTAAFFNATNKLETTSNTTQSFDNSSSTCDASCKSDCVPSCPFHCCQR